MNAGARNESERWTIHENHQRTQAWLQQNCMRNRDDCSYCSWCCNSGVLVMWCLYWFHNLLINSAVVYTWHWMLVLRFISALVPCDLWGYLRSLGLLRNAKLYSNQLVNDGLRLPQLTTNSWLLPVQPSSSCDLHDVYTGGRRWNMLGVAC